MDLTAAFNAVMTAVNGAFEWFSRLPSEVISLVIGTTLFAFFARLILAPLFGGTFNGGSSDKVKNSKGADE